MHQFKNKLTILVVLLFVCYASAQDALIQGTTLTRGRLWTSTAGFGTRTNTGLLPIQFSYPGYYKANEDLTYFGGGNGVTAIWTIAGQKTIMHLKGDPSDFVQQQIKPLQLYRNYNFESEQGIHAPEEWYEGTVLLKETHPNNPNKRLGKLKMRTKSMVWSVPKYDDFVIEELCITNMDTETIEDFYYSYEYSYYYHPDFINDKEYIWDSGLGTFVFFDDTSMPINNNGEEVEYLIMPGSRTGDRGNPGNIVEIGSVDYALQDPALFATSALNITPNKNGESKVWFNIAAHSEVVNSSRDLVDSNPLTPQRETAFTFDPTYEQALQQITTEQEQASWRDLWEDDSRAKDGSVDGNLYERSPIILMNLGPYDIAPGDSIKWTVIKCFGEDERETTQLGNYKATRGFFKDGLKALKENWNAALSLIQNNYVLPSGDYPPPTVGLPPFVSTENQLQVEPWAEFDEDGIAQQGFDIVWQAVTDDYTDPGTGEYDLGGYRLFRSEINITGPWEEIAEISAETADSLRQGDQIIYRVSETPNVPYRYGVTSFDTNGNESGMTAYTYYTHSAAAPTGDDLSKIKVIPNPFRQQSGLLNKSEYNRITFINVPTVCTIRIYTLAGDLVKTIQHKGTTEATWGSSENENYMLTDSYEHVAPGLYVFHVESHDDGTEGNSYIGKFMIIK